MPVITRSLLLYLAIGLVQGLTLYAVVTLKNPTFAALALTLAWVVGFNVQLLGERIVQRGTWILVVGLAAITTAMTAWVVLVDRDEWIRNSWVSSLFLLTYICTAFILSWPDREGRWPRYEDLFKHAWNNMFILLLAAVLTGLFWLMLYLSEQLFRLVGFAPLEALMASPAFTCISIAVVFALGMRMGLENERVIGLLRGVLLTLCRFLLPLAALSVVLFTLALPFSGLQSGDDGGRSIVILLWLVGLTVFMVNGVFQDGQQSAGYPKVLRRLVDACLLCLPVMVGMAGYSLWAQIQQFGLTPPSVVSSVLITICLLHALAGAWAVLPTKAVWLGSLRQSNPLIALLCCVALLLIQTPLLNPLALSARDQVQRLLDGRVAAQNFNVAGLAESLGSPGKQQLEHLSAQLAAGEILDEPTRQVLRQKIEDYQAGLIAKSKEKARPKLEWLGPALDSVEKIDELESSTRRCGTSGCFLYAIDLDNDGRSEVLLIPKGDWPDKVFFLTLSDKNIWMISGTLEGIKSHQRLTDMIRLGKLKPMKSRYQTFEAGEEYFAPIPYDKN